MMRLRRFKIGDSVWVTPIYTALPGVVRAHKGAGQYIVEYNDALRLVSRRDLCRRDVTA